MDIIEIDREDDGRWIAECTSRPGAMCYGKSRAEALNNLCGLLDEIEAGVICVTDDRDICFNCKEPINDDMGHMCP